MSDTIKEAIITADSFNEMNTLLKQALAEICDEKIKDYLEYTFSKPSHCSFTEEKIPDQIQLYYDGDFTMKLNISFEELVNDTILFRDKPLLNALADNFERLAKKLRDA